jgi:hypothetical protein
MNWYSRITADLGVLPDFVAYYEQQLETAKQDVKISGRVEKNVFMMPGLTESYFASLQDIEAVLNYLNIKLRALRRKYFQKYLEGYNRALTSRDAEKYVDGENEVIDFEILINEVALIRNRYLGVLKALESKNFMLGHLIKLKAAGLDGYEL